MINFLQQLRSAYWLWRDSHLRCGARSSWKTARGLSSNSSPNHEPEGKTAREPPTYGDIADTRSDFRRTTVWSIVIAVSVLGLISVTVLRPWIERRAAAAKQSTTATHTLALPLDKCPLPTAGQALVITLIPRADANNKYVMRCHTARNWPSYQQFKETRT